MDAALLEVERDDGDLVVAFSPPEAAVVVYRQEVPIAQDPSGLRALIAGLEGAPGAAAVVDALSMPPEAGLIAQDGRTALVPVASLKAP